jgi:energy-coupling factor transport system permease protein
VGLEAEAGLTLRHPWAWWGWAIGIGLAVNATTNPLLLVLIALAVVAVVLLRRSHAPWARSIKTYLILGVFIIGMRVAFQIVLGVPSGQTVLFTLPQAPLPAWAAGIRLGGPVTAEAIAAAVFDALRLAVMLLGIGAANALANPRHALRSVPAALSEASVAVVIALSVAPQLIESGQRVIKARRLRGANARGLLGLGSLVIPVLSDAFDRSIGLATGMEVRGFARTRGLPIKGTLTIMLTSALIGTLGVFTLLSTSFRWPAVGLMVLGTLGSAVGLRRAGRQLATTHYRPQPWQWRDTAIAASGAVAAIVLMIAAANQPAAFATSTSPLTWPQLTAPMLLVIGLVLAPLPLSLTPKLTPEPVLHTDQRLRRLRPVSEQTGALR